MVKVAFVGEMFYSDRGPDQGLPQPPVGIWPSPGYPDQGLPPIWGGRPPRPDQGLPGGGLRPSHPIVLPPGSIGGTPEHPIYTPPGAPDHPIVLPPGSVGGSPEHPIYYPPYPDQGLPSEQPYPDQGLPVVPGVPTHPWVPPEGAETLPPPPDAVSRNYVVAVWNPIKEEWRIAISGPETPTPK